MPSIFYFLRQVDYRGGIENTPVVAREHVEVAQADAVLGRGVGVLQLDQRHRRVEREITARFDASPGNKPKQVDLLRAMV